VPLRDARAAASVIVRHKQAGAQSSLVLDATFCTTVRTPRARSLTVMPRRKLKNTRLLPCYDSLIDIIKFATQKMISRFANHMSCIWQTRFMSQTPPPRLFEFELNSTFRALATILVCSKGDQPTPVCGVTRIAEVVARSTVPCSPLFV
jgi:hypothetical protein